MCVCVCVCVCVYVCVFGLVSSIIVLFRQRRPCSTRYPTLMNDPRRSFKCISP